MDRLARLNRGLYLPSHIQTIIATMGSGKSGSYLCGKRSGERFFLLEESLDTLQLRNALRSGFFRQCCLHQIDRYVYFDAKDLDIYLTSNVSSAIRERIICPSPNPD